MYGESKKTWKLVLGIIIILPFLGLGGARFIKTVQFDRACGGHIKRAGDANTVEMATEEMKVVIKYLEENKMTEGYTSVLYNTPDEDIGFWHKNLKSSLEELEKVQPETTQLERSNILLKLRQTLLDHTQSGEKVTAPDGISVYPNNPVYFFGLALFILLAGFGVILIWMYSLPSW
jgi:hypothetical protein